MSSHATYTFSFPLNGRALPVCTGAFCQAFDDLEWPLTQVRTGYQLTGYIPYATDDEKLADVYIRKVGTEKILVDIVAVESTTIPDTLERLGQALNTMVETLLGNTLEIQLEAAYRRKLQHTDIATLKEKKGGSLAFIREVLFTAHPAQIVAIIMILNVAVFVAMLIDGVGFFDTNIEKAVDWGAAAKYKVMQGEYWRLFTACFIHFGVGHLLANMVGLIYASIFLMVALNRWQFLLGYLATGLISMAASMWWYSDTITAGASGAIFGCYGMLLGLALTRLFSKADRITIFVYLAIYLGINLLYSFKEEVDAAAHIGGLLSGIAIGLIYSFSMQYPRKFSSALASAAVVILGIGCTAFIIKSTHYSAIEFADMERRFSIYEHDALECYRIEDTTTEVKVRLLDKGIERFEQARLVADSMIWIKNPLPGYVTYAEELRTYAEYRMYEMDLRRQYYLQPTNELNDSIGLMVAQIDSMLIVLKQE